MESILCPETTATSADDICDPLIPADDYAMKYDITRRTVDRYARSGKVERLRQGGKTLIVDKPPIKAETQSVLSETVQSDLVVAPVRNDWIAFGAAQAYAKSRHKWQSAFFVAAFLLFVALLIGSGGGVWFWQSIVISQSQVIASENKLSVLTSNLTEAKTLIDAIQARHDKTAGGLQDRIDELHNTNQLLTIQLATLAAVKIDANSLQASSQHNHTGARTPPD